uniref:Uncharacterized protein n=1 Tax=Siphoviridae sp. ctHhH6 TaxID=2825422 RepID=A0A8S5QEK3_9CAUD|nr:MAG TPA: hypothetical protein [Siphoviridae sp. ctHhH6]
MSESMCIDNIASKASWQIAIYSSNSHSQKGI